jgi:hypothetical protein
VAEKLPRCAAAHPDAPDQRCIRPPHHLPPHASPDGDRWQGDEQPMPLPIVERDTTEAEAVILAILVDRLGGKATITEQEAHVMRARLARSVLWRLDAHRNPNAMEWTIELHKPDSET